MSLTKAEKIKLAEAQIKELEIVMNWHRIFVYLLALMFIGSKFWGDASDVAFWGILLILSLMPPKVKKEEEV